MSSSWVNRCTIVFITSPAVVHPETYMLEEVACSLALAPGLDGCPKIIIADGFKVRCIAMLPPPLFTAARRPNPNPGCAVAQMADSYKWKQGKVNEEYARRYQTYLARLHHLTTLKVSSRVAPDFPTGVLDACEGTASRASCHTLVHGPLPDARRTNHAGLLVGGGASHLAQPAAWLRARRPSRHPAGQDAVRGDRTARPGRPTAGTCVRRPACPGWGLERRVDSSKTGSCSVSLNLVAATHVELTQEETRVHGPACRCHLRR
jgi:hypothetical protein